MLNSSLRGTERECMCGGGWGQAGVSATHQNQTQSYWHSLLPDLLLLTVAKVRLEVAPAMSQWDPKPQTQVKDSQQALTSQAHTQTLHQKAN